MMNSIIQKVTAKKSASPNSHSTPRKNKSKSFGSENVPPPDHNIIAESRITPSKLKPQNASSSPLPPKPANRTPKRKATFDGSVHSVPHAQASVLEPDGNVSADAGVKVIVRIRPLNEEEEGPPIVSKVSEDTVSVIDQHFTFDAVAGVDSSQEDIFKVVGVPLVENCLAGYNSSIFAYGQTGSGKTFTMYGPSNISQEEKIQGTHQGVTPRIFKQLFARIYEEECENAEKQLHYSCRCSFLEIYNEQITDLLQPSQRNLQLREDTKSGVYVENLTEEHVANVDDVTSLLNRGLANRRTGATSINAQSSRSHSVFTCVLELRYKNLKDGSSSLRTSKINLVDLAGSERQKLSGAAGERLKEAGNINRSLSQLGTLINILSEVSQGKQRHIPYRDSRLTFLLQESLGGNAKLAMICAVSPASRCKNETLSTLRFAKRAKGVQNKAMVNEEMEDDVNVLREQIRQLKDELVRMKTEGNGHGDAGPYSTGWFARRSLNILRQSLNQSSGMLHVNSESDDEMEIEEAETGAENKFVEAEGQPDKLLNDRDQNRSPKKPLQNLRVSSESDPLEPPSISMSPRVQEKDDQTQMSTTGTSLIESGNFKRKHLTRSGKMITSPTESLAASLQRGLQIIDEHQQSSNRRSFVRFSFKGFDMNSMPALAKVDAEIQTSPQKSGETTFSTQVKCECKCHDTAVRSSVDPSVTERSEWQLVPVGESKNPDETNHHLSRAVEGVLAGAIRREMVLEEYCIKQAAEIEQLNRLVQQYRHERECNSIIQQSREDKILRLEGLMDGVLPTEDFMEQEFASLMHEHEILKDKYENHPELLRTKVEQQHLIEELDKYRNFYDLGEREALLEEIHHLRDQLQAYLESGKSPASFRKQRLSSTAKSIRRLKFLPENEPNPIDASLPSSEDSKIQDNSDIQDDKWIERETEWISLAEELKSDIDEYRCLAEQRQQEMECEKRCSDELKEALQMAMEGHSRLLEQYADLQEKHINLLAQNRKIKEGIADVQRAAAKAGVKGTESRFIKSQAAQLIALQIERDKERKRFKEEITALQAQLRDTAEAVQAAGELLVRLKEAEEATAIAQESAAISARNAEKLRRDIEKLNRKHATEIAAMNQKILDARLERSSICPTCKVADRAKYDLPFSNKANDHNSYRAQFEPFDPPRYDDDFTSHDRQSWFTGYDRCNI